MNVGILGSGEVAQALAKGFLGRGDRVMLGTRDPSKLADWKTASGDRAFVQPSNGERVAAAGIRSFTVRAA